MFRAIGIGSSHALPSAAALNWLLKDGLGRLSRCIYTASLGSAFDTNLKVHTGETCNASSLLHWHSIIHLQFMILIIVLNVNRELGSQRPFCLA